MSESYLDLYRELGREIRNEVPNHVMHKIIALAKISYMIGIESDKKDKDVKKQIKENKAAIEYHFNK